MPELIDHGKKVTCKEAADLLKENAATKVWFRPNGVIDYKDPDNDLAIAWLIEGVVLVKELTNAQS